MNTRSPLTAYSAPLATTGTVPLPTPLRHHRTFLFQPRTNPDTVPTVICVDHPVRAVRSVFFSLVSSPPPPPPTVASPLAYNSSPPPGLDPPSRRARTLLRLGWLTISNPLPHPLPFRPAVPPPSPSLLTCAYLHFMPVHSKTPNLPCCLNSTTPPRLLYFPSPSRSPPTPPHTPPAYSPVLL